MRLYGECKENVISHWVMQTTKPWSAAALAAALVRCAFRLPEEKRQLGLPHSKVGASVLLVVNS